MPDLEHDERPWGQYVVLDQGAGHKVKRIAVSAGKRLSYQVHNHRSEHWFVLGGRGIVTLDGTAIDVTSGTTIDVAVGIAHRIENLGSDELVFIEVQYGDYLGEDDIIRIEDDFGRAETRMTA